MAVVPASQGTVIAARLLLRAEAHFRKGNCKRISLDTTAPLERAILFYERFGFAPSGKIQDFSGMPLMESLRRFSACERDARASPLRQAREFPI
jgi:N-acetylglutamate synthase-like GNAT family acetyltransferase